MSGVRRGVERKLLKRRVSSAIGGLERGQRCCDAVQSGLGLDHEETHCPGCAGVQVCRCAGASRQRTERGMRES